MARKTLTDHGVEALKPRASRYHFPDPELKGHYVRVLTTGTKVFAAVAIDLSGKQRWVTLGKADLIGRSTREGEGRHSGDQGGEGSCWPAELPGGRRAMAEASRGGEGTAHRRTHPARF
jgi:hypothetical protein